MIPQYLSAIWAATAAPMGNHLWQSTLCLVIAGLLTLVLRKNHARARYGLWLAASIKFLIPFSLLITLGTHLAKPRVVQQTGPGFFLALEQVSQPFTNAATGSQTVEKSRRPAQDAGLRYRSLPASLVGVWFCGFGVVLFVWYARWRQISAALREAVPLREGREVEALHRLERVAGIRNPIELLLSPSTLEPGIFGIVKPVLLWPKGLSERLDDAQLEAIFAHEVWHVRRRDNLAAAIHMVVEAIFWFHPLAWWLGARLVEERERACDEEVLQMGSERLIYAESILKTCEFCVESPLTCVSGVTGADLRKRIVRIMTDHMPIKLSFGRKLLLTALGIAAIAAPVVFGLVYASQIRAQSPPTIATPLPSFEVASIKPNRSPDGIMQGFYPPGRFSARYTTLKRLIAFAYYVKPFQVAGGPSWVDSEKFDIDAKEPDAVAEELRKLSRDQQRQEVGLLLQSLLADRFRLKVTHETRELPIYALTVAKNGPKLHAARPGDTYPNGLKGDDGRPIGHGEAYQFGKDRLIAQGIPLQALVDMMSFRLGRTILDQTGLKGKYDFNLQWTPDETPAAMPAGPGGDPNGAGGPAPDFSGPSLFTAIQEQLGLKLESTKGPVEFIVIDHIEKPSEN